MDDHATLVTRYYEELFNQGRIDLVPALLHPDYVNHSPGWPELPRDRHGVALVVTRMRAAFPDLRYTIEDLVVGSDAVAVRTTVRGTHRGPFGALAPTGRSFAVSQITIERIRDGRIVAHHRLTDELALLRQLGAVPG
jgi:steroid delta-isomerase-like uncharacterized protein